MTDSTLNKFVAAGTAADRVLFTPSPPTPASGAAQGYFWHETDTGDTYSWKAGTGWIKVNGVGTGPSTSLSQISSSLSGAISSTTSLSSAVSTVDSNESTSLSQVSSSLSGTISTNVLQSTSLSQISSSLSGAISSTTSLSTAVSTVISGSISTVTSSINSLSTAVGGGGGGTVSIVQTNGFIGDSAGTATLALGSAPTAGSLLIAMGTFWTSARTINSAWTTIINTTPGANSGVFMAWRVATDSDTGSANISSAINNPSSYSLLVFEVSGAIPVALAGAIASFQETSATSYAYHLASMKDGSAILGFVATGSDNTAPSSTTGATQGTTVTGTTTNETPRQITPFTKTGWAKGSAGPVTAAFAGSQRRYGAQLVLISA